MPNHIVQAAIDLIKRNEGLRLRAYRDIADVWTVGYGHTPASPNQVVTEAQATSLLMSDIAHAADAVTASTSDVPTTDNQYSAMVSLTFNIGPGAFRGSTVLRRHRGGDYPAAGDAFLLWDKAHVNGALQVVAGLHRRREEERALYLRPSAAVVAPAPPAPVVPGPVLPDADKTGARATSAMDVVEAVKTLQRMLIDIKEYRGRVDGVCGPQTSAGAMAAYNASHIE